MAKVVFWNFQHSFVFLICLHSLSIHRSWQHWLKAAIRLKDTCIYHISEGHTGKHAFLATSVAWWLFPQFNGQQRFDFDADSHSHSPISIPIPIPIPVPVRCCFSIFVLIVRFSTLLCISLPSFPIHLFLFWIFLCLPFPFCFIGSLCVGQPPQHSNCQATTELATHAKALPFFGCTQIV